MGQNSITYFIYHCVNLTLSLVLKMNTHQSITLVECPRDALQGFSRWVNTSDKIAYYQSLLKVGFHTLDCGSFVSSNAIPQMSDTSEVIKDLDISNTSTKLLTIVANERGALEAIKHEKISYLVISSALIHIGKYFPIFFSKQYWVSVKLEWFLSPLLLRIDNLSVPSIS